MTLFTEKDRANVCEAINLLMDRLEAKELTLKHPVELDINLHLYDRIAEGDEDKDIDPTENCITEDTNMSSFVNPPFNGCNWDPDWKEG